MYRKVSEYLLTWMNRTGRKPLVIRGARQVGKTWLVRNFAKDNFRQLLEINFERDREPAESFSSNNPQAILRFLETCFKQQIIPGKTLLFLDEIQAAPQVLASLRYFHEEIPELHIIAAGSLLEFLLEKTEYSMPVGRIEYLHLGPMSFEEFLHADGGPRQLQYLQEFTLNTSFDPSFHNLYLEKFRIYCLTGGMPEVIKNFYETDSWLEVERIQEGILSTYRDDFSKYSGKIDHALLQKTFDKLPMLVGQKFKYVNIDRQEKSKNIADVLHLLEMAKIVHRIQHSHANGVPLGAEVNERDFKPLYLDTGLLIRACRLKMMDIYKLDDLMLVNSGAISEQFTGQHLLCNFPSFQKPELYYWTRQKAGTSSEVDYIIQLGTKIIPIEVKSGKTGSLKSLQVFMAEKKADLALRFNIAPPSIVETKTTIPTKKGHPYRLLSLPFYLIEQSSRLLRETIKE